MTVVKYLTDLNVTHLQFVLATHSHTDHIGGIPDVAASGLVNQDTVYIYKTYNLNPYAQPTWHNDYYYNLALDAMKAKGATLLNVLDPNTVALAKLGATFVNVPASDSNKTDEHIDFTMGDFLIKLFNLHTESLLNENLNAIVTTVTKDNSRAVLMSDMEMDEYKESKIVNAILSEDSTTPVDVYQVGHHGYYTSTSVDTINAMKAKNYVISTIDRGAIPFEHTYFNYYMEKTGKVYRTSQNGKAVVAEFGDSGVSMLKMDNTAKALTSTAFPWVAAITDGWHDWYPNEKSWNERKEKGVSWIYIQSKKPVNGWVLWNGGWYYCNQYGTMLTGWVLADNNWYLLDEKGIMRTGWVYSNGKWYYLNQKGIMQTGVQTIGSTKYCFNNQGVMQTGWTYYGGKWYFANSSGGLQIGWKQDGGKWYLLGTDGAMKTGWLGDGGKRYYLTASGAMKTGWLKLGGKRYYFTSGGAMKTGWLKLGGKRYYFTSGGAMKTGWLTLGGKRYYFTSSGAMKTGWLTLKGKKYYFGANGVLDEKKTNDEKKETGAAESGSTVKSTAAKESDENKVVRTKGELVAQYALQFVGNPYVYGGNSLTKGTDCSGFVMLIYRHFGVSLPHYDAAIRTKGKRVASLKEAKAGDIICYYGHVAIYLGDGRIVHASNSRDGIKISERADYRTIAGIRRIFD